MKQKLEMLSKRASKLRVKAKSYHGRVRKRHLLIAGGSTIIVLAAASGTAVWYYKTRALPGVTVASAAVGGKTPAEIKRVAENRRDALRVRFAKEDKQVTAGFKELGLEVAIDQTVAQAMQAGRHQGLWRAVAFWRHDEVPLTASVQKDIFNAFIAEHFSDLAKGAKDAQISYNQEAGAFAVIPGEAGLTFDYTSFERLLPGLLQNPRTASLAVTTAPVKPLVTTEALEPLKQETNQRTKLSIRFIYQGRLKYFADPPDIAKWATFTPEASGKVTVSYDKEKIKQFLTTTVGPYIAAPPKDRKIIKDQNSGHEIVIQEGQVGRQLTNIDALAAEIAEATQKGVPWEKEVAVTEAPFKTEVLTGYDKWVEVDLSEQRTTLYTGATPVASFTISSGLARTPTVTGEFSIWYKTASQTMSGGSRAAGDYYSLPNVTWVSYFHKDYSFHTAYWHNNFGTPMSHGCVNMREADAKALYDFAPKGTKVVVHQ